MAGYIECHVKGDRRAYIDVSVVAGVVSSPGLRHDDVASPDKPLSIMFRAGETIEIYGMAASEFLCRMFVLKRQMKNDALDFKVDLLEAPVDDQAKDA